MGITRYYFMFSPSYLRLFTIVVRYFDFSLSYFRHFIMVVSAFHHRSFVFSSSYFRFFTIVSSTFHRLSDMSTETDGYINQSTESAVCGKPETILPLTSSSFLDIPIACRLLVQKLFIGYSNAMRNSARLNWYEEFSAIQIPCEIQCASYSMRNSVQFRFHVLFSVNQIPWKFNTISIHVQFYLIQYQICIYTMRDSVCCKSIHLWKSEYWTRFECSLLSYTTWKRRQSKNKFTVLQLAANEKGLHEIRLPATAT
jgi:hypothetical protein